MNILLHGKLDFLEVIMIKNLKIRSSFWSAQGNHESLKAENFLGLEAKEVRDIPSVINIVCDVSGSEIQGPMGRPIRSLYLPGNYFQLTQQENGNLNPTITRNSILQQPE